MNVYFAEVAWGELSDWLDRRLQPGRFRSWTYPREDYLVLIYEFRNPQKEFDLEEFDVLCARLGGPPTCSISIELRRSKGELAEEAAGKLVRELLQVFRGVADDTSGNLL